MPHNYSSAEFEHNYTYLGDDLGANWFPNHTLFRVWAPTAEAVFLHLYRSGNSGSNDRIQAIPMQPSCNGTWTLDVDGNLNGVYYTYSVTRDGQVVESCDPYSRAVGVNGWRSMVIDLASTNPVGWEKDADPNAGLRFPECVLYELHIRDLSMSASSGITHKGKFLGLAETGTHTTNRQPTGLDYIKALGVTHIHLLPVFDYGSIDESDPENKHYNWGYDPAHFNVPEGSYSTDPFHGEVRIREMKQMVQALHQNGLSVIMDVVYNHVYHTQDFSVERIVPGYFHRPNSNASGCGNDTASERTMVRKYIVDSVNYWAEEYHIDGFRFDLVGLLDTATINEIMFTVRKKHPNVLFYGEGWDMPTNVTNPNISLAVQRNADMMPGFAFFNDSFRDTLRGSVFHLNQPGYISGAALPKDVLFDRFCGRVHWSNQPGQVVNYVSCHDNHTLYDRIAIAMPQANHEELARRSRFAAVFNLLSMGIPFFQAGEEMLRTKKSRPGVYIGNSYRSSDRINAIKWNHLKDAETRCTMEYYKGLIAIRKQYPLFTLSNPAEIAAKITMLEACAESLSVFQLKDESASILCIYNPSSEACTLKLPEGTWNVLVYDDAASPRPLKQVKGEVQISPISAMVLVQR